jgi:hypothetical protein
MPTGVYKRKPMSEDTKLKIGIANSISLKGKKLSKERVEKIRNRMLVNNPMFKEENKQKVSITLTGIKRAKGKNSKNWKGDNITYFHLHKWLRDNFGKANKCENKLCNCMSKNYEWALIHEKEYIRDRNNFIMLCASCHRKYDFTEQIRINLSNSHKGQVAWNKGIIQKANELKEQAKEL